MKKIGIVIMGIGLILMLASCSIFKIKKSPVFADGKAPTLQPSGFSFSDSSDVVCMVFRQE